MCYLPIFTKDHQLQSTFFHIHEIWFHCWSFLYLSFLLFYKSGTFFFPRLLVVSVSWQHVSFFHGCLERNRAVNRLCGCAQLKRVFGWSKLIGDASKEAEQRTPSSRSPSQFITEDLKLTFGSIHYLNDNLQRKQIFFCSDTTHAS